MTNLTIEHDPDSGCRRCPLQRYEAGHLCQAAGRRLLPIVRRPAPDWCPLRTARVIVQRPGGIRCRELGEACENRAAAVRRELGDWLDEMDRMDAAAEGDDDHKPGPAAFMWAAARLRGILDALAENDTESQKV